MDSVKEVLIRSANAEISEFLPAVRRSGVQNIRFFS